MGYFRDQLNLSGGPLTIGEFLAENRRKQGKSVRDVEKATKIGAKYIEAIENDDYAQFAAPVYAKGFIRNYADFLAVDPAPLIRQFNIEHGTPARQDHSTRYEVFDMYSSDGSKTKLIYAAGALLIGFVFIVWLFGSLLGRPAENVVVETTTTVSAQPALTPSVASSAPQPFTISLTAVAERGTWMKVTSDGKKVFEDVLAKGRSMDFKATGTLNVVVGNSSGLTVKVNGQDTGVFDKEDPGTTEKNFTSADVVKAAGAAKP